MKLSLHQISLVLMAGSLSALIMTAADSAHAGSLRLNGTVVDTLGRPVSAANTTTTFFLGTTLYPPIDDFTFNAVTDTDGKFSVGTIVSPNYLFFLYGRPSASVLVSATASSVNFLSERFTVNNFSRDEQFNYVAEATFTITPVSVPEPSYALATLAVAALGAASVLKRKQKLVSSIASDNPAGIN